MSKTHYEHGLCTVKNKTIAIEIILISFLTTLLIALTGTTITVIIVLSIALFLNVFVSSLELVPVFINKNKTTRESNIIV